MPITCYDLFLIRRTVSTTQFLSGGTTERLISAGADRLCRIWDLRQSRGPLVTIRTDSGINRLSVSGSTTMFVGLLTGDSSLDPGSSLSSSAITTSPGGGGTSGGTGGLTVSTNASASANPVNTGNATGLATAAPTGEGPGSSLTLQTSATIATSTSVVSPAVSFTPAMASGSALANMVAPGSSGHAQSWATNTMRILALPLENRGIKFFDLNGNRIGRITRSSSRVSCAFVCLCVHVDVAMLLHFV